MVHLDGDCCLGIRILLLASTNKAVQKAVKESMSIIDPNLTPYKPKPAGGGGGGGDKSITPVTKGQLPKPSLKQFVPPMIVKIEHPKLMMDPTIIAPPDTVLPQNNLPQWGDPLAKLGIASNGTGFGAGMGSGSGGGVGSGNGGGFGAGSGGGVGGGIYKSRRRRESARGDF